MVSYIISRLVVLVFGTLYPAYASYKAVKTRNVKEYVKWMMYWIVFALFTFLETVADMFASLLPFYYEAKILFIFWLISPWTKGSTYLYRKFVHPTLSKREQEIDEYISQASNKGYEALKKVSKDGLTIAANVVMTSAMKGQTTLMDQLKNYSKNVAKNTIPEEDETTDVEEKDGGTGILTVENNETERREKDYDRSLRERLHSEPNMSPSLLDSLESLDNRIREERDNIRYVAEMEEQVFDEDDSNREPERVTQSRRKRPEPSPQRGEPRYQNQQSLEEYDNDTNSMYLPEDDYALRRTPSLHSLREQRGHQPYLSSAGGGMSRSHYASADSLTRRPRKRQEPVAPSTERPRGRYALRNTGIKMTRY